MPVQSGARFGSYEILSPLGSGGMGEVYRARDTTLNRDVAIKVLPELFALDADRLARFTREAQALAALNHPNIAQVYGFEAIAPLENTRALVMELVDGEDLSDSIARGPMPLADVVPIARQIADALEAAHEQGIVHRDLKPANVKVRPDGTVKVLDFGLAKAMDPPAASSGDAMRSPTMTDRATRMGMIIGTAAYMSPEQARGKAVDKRADIWAFGVVLFEMLTGRRAFPGDDISDVLVAVLSRDVDWSALPAETPAALRRLLARCLDRDAKSRLRDIGEARVLLSSPDRDIGPAPPQVSPGGRVWIPALIALAALLAAAAAASWWTRLRGHPSTAREPSRFALALPADGIIHWDIRPTHSVAIARDGRTIAYVGGPADRERVFVRRLSDPVIRPLTGTEGAVKAFFAPDGEWIAFFVGGQLKKIATSGGAPVLIADAPLQFSGSWADDGTIVLGGMSGLVSLNPASGAKVPLTTLGPGESEHSNPQCLPGSRAVLFTIETNDVTSFDDAKIAVQVPGGQPKVLINGGAMPTYVSSGHIVYLRGDSVMAVAFDAEKLEVTGKPRAVTAGGMFNTLSAEGLYAVSPNGTLVYGPGGPLVLDDLSLYVIDRRGSVAAIEAPQRFYANPVFSRDGRFLALTQRAANDDTWTYDFERRAFTRITFTNGDNDAPVWYPDGSRIVYWNGRTKNRGLYSRASDGGGEERLTTADFNQIAGDFSNDGHLLAFVESRPGSGDDIYILDMRDRTRPPIAFVSTKYDEQFPQFSPDGHWLAYVSTEGGEADVYVVPYPGRGRKMRVSNGGGTRPLWRSDGRELVYRNDNAIMTVSITPGETLQASAPRELVRLPAAARPDYAMSPDGARFVFLQVQRPRVPLTELRVTVDWLDELAQLLPGGK